MFLCVFVSFFFLSSLLFNLVALLILILHCNNVWSPPLLAPNELKVQQTWILEDVFILSLLLRYLCQLCSLKYRAWLHDNVPDRSSAKVEPVGCHVATMALTIKTVTVPKGGLHGKSCHPVWDVSASELSWWRTFWHLGSKSAGTLPCNPVQMLSLLQDDCIWASCSQISPWKRSV